MKNVITTALLAAVCCALLSCSKSEDQRPGRITIAVIPKGTTHEFWKSIHAGAVKAGRELDVDIIWKGPLKEDDRESQISIMEDFITRGVDGIVLAPLDDIALRGPVRNAVRSGIEVIVIDSGLKSKDYVSFVATDNRLGGHLAARKMAELLGDTGKVVMLRLQEGSASTTNREEGFLEVIAEYPGIEVVSSNQYAGPTTETAYQASENLLAPLKDAQGNLTIDGIFCVNESSTFGMLRTLQDAGLVDQVKFIGFDSSGKLVEAMEKGELDGLVLQNPFAMGYIGVKTMVAHLKGEPVEKRIDTGVTMVTRENMQQPEVRQLLLPDLSKWLGQ